jgi:hypothetical protein
MKQFRKVVFEESNVDSLQTISTASLAMLAFRKILKKPIFNPFVKTKWLHTEKGLKKCYQYNEKLDDYIRNSYFGGRCEIINTNLIKDASYIDFVSMFSSVMHQNKFPSGIPTFITDKEYLMKCIEENKVGFILCNVIPNSESTEYPILPEKREFKTMFTNCQKTQVFTIVELNVALKLGYEINPINGFVYYQADTIFTEYVEKFFDLKAKSKGGKRAFAKLMLNSLYGKFGQYYIITANNYHILSSQADLDKLIDEFEEFDLVSENVAITRQTTISIKPFMNVAIASYVTAYARIKLWENLHLCELNKITLYYSDTDSFVIPNVFQEKLRTLTAFGKELGMLDIEHNFEEAQFFALKCYAFREINKKTQKSELHLKMKGIERSKIKQIVDSSDSIEEIMIKIKEPIQLAERYMKFNSALRQKGGFLGTNALCKHYSMENLKREFDNSGKSIAWNDESVEQFNFNYQMFIPEI